MFLAQAGDWASPTIDWHAIAPELILIVGINIVLGTDLLIDGGVIAAMRMGRLG